MRESELFCLCERQQLFYARLIGLMSIIIGILGGCTLKSSHAPLRPEVLYDYRAPDLGASYNKPYRIKGNIYYPLRSATDYSEEGIASWYGFESGNRTAMGTRFKPYNLTAAHKTLPLPTWVRVTNLSNGRFVDVLVNDRGPFKKNRLIDLSQGAAKKINLDGLGKVRVEYIDQMK
ncbi:rare lipoprotein A [Nitrosomonas cryotolerans]|uniref:Endolytic peptidoglycan transglycosylase RlpA n=2 Tax=Nitrosomonas cryotolerans TaxID=44575 RepID=A0A1N6IMY7_9PROT|nr:rare lipoprotein A [Nitrosomonas cryotolerans]SIO33325.1 rare lipoprotein A [Nitrosomonas cryotolerans ATCC 49181]